MAFTTGILDRRAKNPTEFVSPMELVDNREVEIAHE